MRKLLTIGAGAAFVLGFCVFPAMAATTFSVDNACAQGGSAFGLTISHDGTAGDNAFLVDTSPADETRHIVQVFGKLDTGFSMTSGDTHSVIQGRDAGGGGAGTVWRAQVRLAPDGQYRMTMWTLFEAGSGFVGEVFFTENAWQCFQFDWQAASSASANDGVASVKKCAGLPKTASGLDTPFVIDQERLGSMGGVDAGTNGPICWDNFDARRAP